MCCGQVQCGTAIYKLQCLCIIVIVIVLSTITITKILKVIESITITKTQAKSYTITITETQNHYFYNTSVYVSRSTSLIQSATCQLLSNSAAIKKIDH